MLRVSFFGFMILSFFMTGCAGKNASTTVEKSVSLPASYLVKNIIVDIDGSKLAQDRIASAKKYGVGNRIESGVKTLLQKNAHFDSSKGDMILRISVTNLRLRSGASAFWLGAMAGADSLAVNVSVTQGAQTVTTFKTNTSTILGGLILPAPSQRINRMVKTLSERIVSSL